MIPFHSPAREKAVRQDIHLDRDGAVVVAEDAFERSGCAGSARNSDLDSALLSPSGSARFFGAGLEDDLRFPMMAD